VDSLMRRAYLNSKLPLICTRYSWANLHHVRRVVGRPAASIPNDRYPKAMNYSEVAVVPAAFALLTATFMYAGTKRLAEGASHTTAVIRVALFLLCTLIAIAIGSASD
jgi:hypothetical protein